MESNEVLPYTDNTKEIRLKLEMVGYRPLSFFQGKKYIRPMITNWANKDESWKVYEYSTFDDPEELNYPTNYLQKLDFINELIKEKDGI
jgi:hypothetical protein